MIDKNRVISRYQAANQNHVLDHFDTLSEEAKEVFLKQLDSIKVEDLSALIGAAFADQQNQDGEDDNITPFSKHVGRTTDKEESIVAYGEGIKAISRGEVAALVLAGGQGTRLGFAGPKGMYNIGLPSGYTLFQLLAERLKKLKEIASCQSLPFYIMTSPINHEETTTFFKKNNYFGLPENDVLFFQQGMLPCMTEDGKIILESAGKVAMAPDG
jgi:UDP-N-acetylglucosamine/UDP-N-acetylgalactosamine diphosphorylase